MWRPRGLHLLAPALVCLVALSGCADASDLAVAARPGGGAADAPDGGAAQMPDGTPPPPEAGQCRPTPQAVLERPVDPTQPVDCSEPHTLETFAVIELSAGADADRVRRRAVAECRPRLGAYLGRDDTAATRVSWFYFVAGSGPGPSRLRCDVGLSTTTATGPLETVTGSLEDVLAGGVPPAQRICLASPPDPRQAQPLVSCTEPHVSELVPSSRRLGEQGSPYPGARRLLEANADWCRRLVTEVDEDAISQVEVPTEAAWRAGLLDATCWAVAPPGTTLPPRGTTI